MKRGNADKKSRRTQEPKENRFHKGDCLTILITDLSDTGDGIGQVDGFIFFVKDAVPGDTVEATVMKVKSRYGFAHLDAISIPSPDRVTPPCPVARSCGGCQLQAMSYEAQLAFKERRVCDTLIRIGRVEEALLKKILLPICGAGEGENLRYRNKSQLPVSTDSAGRVIAGYYAARTHCVISAQDCLLGDEVFTEIRRLILAHVEQNRIPAYEESTGTGVLRHILIRRGYHSGQIGVTLIVNSREKGSPDRLFAGAGELADRLFAEIPGMVSLSVNINAARTNVVLGDRLVPVRGQPWIEDTMCGLRFRISPLSFYQVNTRQAEKLYRQAMDFAGLSGSETVIDLYCGIGTITLLAAQQAARVIGVEVVPEAVENAKYNAQLNGIVNAEFRVGKAEEVLPALLEEGKRADVLIVDPPRAGLDPACVEAVRLLAPDRIDYISCNPATLARDLALFTDGGPDGAAGYRLTAVRAFDLFAQTTHVESCVLLERVSNRKADSHVKLNVKMEDYYHGISEMH